VRYLIRLNPRAFNPLTRKVIAERLWEVEQCELFGHDGLVKSAKVIWHCADVRIDKQNISQFFELPKEGEKPWQYECFGVCLRAFDDAIEIRTGAADASGN
jgi:hypothetical protein